jgi:hypothetical protein
MSNIQVIQAASEMVRLLKCMGNLHRKFKKTLTKLAGGGYNTLWGVIFLLASLKLRLERKNRMDAYEIVKELSNGALPSYSDTGEIYLMVVKYDDGMYGIEINEDLSCSTCEEIMNALDKNGFLETFPELESISNECFETEIEALKLAEELTKKLVCC